MATYTVRAQGLVIKRVCEARRICEAYVRSIQGLLRLIVERIRALNVLERATRINEGLLCLIVIRVR